MPENFYSDNADLRFHLRHIDLAEVVRLREQDYAEAEQYPEAPEDYADALDSYHKVLEMLGEICGENIAPRSRDVDLHGATFAAGEVCYAPGTKENLEDLRKADLMGVTLPRKFGGLNMPTSLYAMMMEMVSRADASLQNLVGLQDIAETITKFGTEDQKERFLPRFASGEVDGAMVLTEPEAGSDLQAVQTRAWQDAETGKWYLNGMKRFITNGCAQVQLVLARSEEGTKDGRGLSMFICERGPELKVRRIEEKLGIHGSPTCELQYNDVPAELVGSRRRGLTRYVMSLMNGARVAISSQAVGIAEAAYRSALVYARAREQFGVTIDTFPAVYEMLVRSKVQVVAARTLLYETTKYVDLREAYEHLVEHGDPETLPPDARAEAKRYSRIAAELTPLSKALSTEMANRVAYDSLQIHGGTGYMKDFNVERYCRDARITNIYEGTTQLQYVAAVGGVIQRVLAPLMEEMSHLPYEGKLRRLASAVDVARDKLRRAVTFVLGRKDAEYQDLMAWRLCEMETAVFVSYLMLRDALADKEREPLAERYVLDVIPSVGLHHEVVTSGDTSLIDRQREILAM
ncbi:MAG TPA: acyl-CoA dehydrogenase family protein [Deferrisomatales bacterium]|nr:acyl-CoA dehydrogenase family protein [Deferrisomatales bacterium]